MANHGKFGAPLLSPKMLALMQKHARRGMQTQVQIQRPVFGSDIRGDDEYDRDPNVIGSTLGWLHSKPTREMTQDGGIVTVNTYRLNLPVGTDIRPRDRCLINDNIYVVVDTTADETWPTMLDCSLRLRE